MKLFIARHGETKANIEKLIQSNESELSEDGLKQADKVAERLKDEPFDCVYVSSSVRARQTAEAILKYHPDTEAIYDDRLQERDCGKYIGRPSSEMRQDIDASGQEFTLFKPEGGESWYEAGARFCKFYEESILPRHKNSDDTILIVSHGTVLMNFLLWLDGELEKSVDHNHQYEAYHPKNTAVSVVTVDGKGNPKIITLNDQSHLS
jgi:broad specificity phosphatase PhoE